MEKPKPIEVEETVQMPAILVNNTGDELIDPLEQVCMRLDDVSRVVTRYYLSAMQREIDLDSPRPTLAQRTRFNRLSKLNSILVDLTKSARGLNDWRTTHTNLPEEVKKTVVKVISRLTKISLHLSQMWLSLSVPIESMANLRNSQIMDKKAIEYHVNLEDFLEVLIRLILRLQKMKEVTQLNHLPIVPETLAKIEVSFPVKLVDHDTVAAEIHAKK